MHTHLTDYMNRLKGSERESQEAGSTSIVPLSESNGYLPEREKRYFSLMNMARVALKMGNLSCVFARGVLVRNTNNLKARNTQLESLRYERVGVTWSTETLPH